MLDFPTGFIFFLNQFSTFLTQWTPSSWKKKKIYINPQIWLHVTVAKLRRINIKVSVTDNSVLYIIILTAKMPIIFAKCNEEDWKKMKRKMRSR